VPQRLTENELSYFSWLWHDGCGKTIIDAQDSISAADRGAACRKCRGKRSVPDRRRATRAADRLRVAAYAATSDSDAFVIRTSNGRIIAALPASFAAQVAGWPAAKDSPSYFRPKNLGNLVRDYNGLSIVLTLLAKHIRSIRNQA
jgi:hypothetical protein